MAGKSDFVPNKLSFDTAAFMSLFKNICNVYLDDLSKELQNLVMGEIWINGNGSYKIMRLTACAAVKETKREITNDHILLEVGIDMDDLKSRSEAIYVRVYVVLHGNQSEGRLHEKPGVATWNKHVLSKGVPDPDNRDSDNYLPDKFNKEDVFVDIVGKTSENVQNDANRYVKIFLDGITNSMKNINLSAFVKVV